MKIWILSLATFAAFQLFGLASFAQMSGGENPIVFAPCTDSHGVAATYFRTADPKYGPAFSTYMQNGQPGIIYNLSQMGAFSSSIDTVRFIFFHECGHLALGHLDQKVNRAKTNQEELAADCYAAQRAKAAGLNMNNILKDVDMLPRDPTHPSGAVRAANIVACYNRAPQR